MFSKKIGLIDTYNAMGLEKAVVLSHSRGHPPSTLKKLRLIKHKSTSPVHRKKLGLIKHKRSGFGYLGIEHRSCGVFASLMLTFPIMFASNPQLDILWLVIYLVCVHLPINYGFHHYIENTNMEILWQFTFVKHFCGCCN